MRNRIFGIMTAVLLLSACGDSAPAASSASKAGKRKAGKEPAVTAAVEESRPRIVSTVPYVYAAVGKRDPFRSPVEEARESNGTCQEPLCQWDLDQLVLVAVVTGDSSPFAMVEDPQGRGHIVHRNSPMGKQGGKLTQILRDSITVTEYWRGPDGKLSPNPVSLQLRGERPVLTAQDLSTGQDL